MSRRTQLVGIEDHRRTAGHATIVLGYCALIVFGSTYPVFATTDPDYELQWGLANTGQSVAGQVGISGADINIASAWGVHDGSPGVIVAVVGQGVDPHPEFADRLLPGRAFIGDPFDASDTVGVGTHVAGIIAAASDNGLGIAGIDPHSIILPVRVTDGSLSTEAVAAAGIVWAVDQGARVIVVTRSYHIGSIIFADAVQYADDRDVLVVAPVGDEENPEVLYPAAFGGCMAISATTNRDEFAPISNWSSAVELAAPGQQIWSTARGGAGFEYRSGSTIAAGFVAGVAAIIRSYAPQLTASEVRQLLVDTAVDVGEAGIDDHFGAGRLDAAAALALATAPAIRFAPIDLVPQFISPQHGATFRVRIASVTETVLPASAFLYYRLGAGPFVASLMAPLGGDVYEAAIPPVPCGSVVEYYLRARGHLGTFVNDPIVAPSEVFFAEAVTPRTLFHDDFETDNGWVVSVPDDEPVSGAWVRDIPNATSIQPGFDASPGPNGACFLTGQYLGGAEYLTDLDGGPVTLTSPDIALEEGDAEIAFRAWFLSQNGVIDVLDVAASTDGGVSWVLLDTIETGVGWRDFTYRLSDYPTLSGDTLRLRFSASDAPSDSLTEAAIDEVRVTALLCTVLQGDANGDGVVNLADFAALADCFVGPDTSIPAGPCGPTDLTGDGTIDLRDFSVLQRWLGAQ